MLDIFDSNNNKKNYLIYSMLYKDCIIMAKKYKRKFLDNINKYNIIFIIPFLFVFQ